MAHATVPTAGLLVLVLVLGVATAQPVGSLYFVTEVNALNGDLGVVKLALNPGAPWQVSTLFTLDGALRTEGVVSSTAPILCTDSPEDEFHCMAFTLTRAGAPKNPRVPAACSPACAPGATCCSDPAATNTTVDTCFNISSVDDCSQINDGVGPPTGVTYLANVASDDPGSLGVVRSVPSPVCWSLALETFSSNPKSVLCAEEEPCVPAAKTPCGNNFIKRVDLSGQDRAADHVAKLPKHQVAYIPMAAMAGANNAGADNYTQFYHLGLNNYATQRSSFYTYNTLTKKVSETPFSEVNLIHAIAAPVESTDDVRYHLGYREVFAVVDVRSTLPNGTAAYTTTFGRININGTVNFQPLNSASLELYTQINYMVSDRQGYYVYMNALRADHSLWLVGLDARTGAVVMEWQRPLSLGLSPSFVDLVWIG